MDANDNVSGTVSLVDEATNYLVCTANSVLVGGSRLVAILFRLRSNQDLNHLKYEQAQMQGVDMLSAVLELDW